VDKKQIEQKIKEILADRLDIDINKIKLDSDLVDDLGMDSLGAVEVMYEIREKFGVDIPESELSGIEKVKDIVEYFRRTRNKKI